MHHIPAIEVETDIFCLLVLLQVSVWFMTNEWLRLERTLVTSKAKGEIQKLIVISGPVIPAVYLDLKWLWWNSKFQPRLSIVPLKLDLSGYVMCSLHNTYAWSIQREKLKWMQYAENNDLDNSLSQWKTRQFDHRKILLCLSLCITNRYTWRSSVASASLDENWLWIVDHHNWFGPKKGTRTQNRVTKISGFLDHMCWPHRSSCYTKMASTTVL